MKLNAARRNRLSDLQFALPGRRYPIEDANHARNALARIAEFGSPKQKATVRAKVKRKFPGIKVGN